MMHFVTFVLPAPSLQHLAAVKIVSLVSSQSDNFTQIARSFQERSVPLRKVKDDELIELMEEEVESKVSLLPLPEPCFDLLLNFIKPIRMEIITWCHYHVIDDNKLQFLYMLLYNQLRWTMHGAVDYARTAQLMVRDERLDLEFRYEMACLNCLEDQARELFERMNAEGRLEFDVNQFKVRKITKSEHHKLIQFFNCTLSGTNADQRNGHFPRFPGDTINRRLFEDTLRWGTRATCEYFYKKLNPEEKKRGLIYGQYEKRAYVPMERIPTCNFFSYFSLTKEQHVYQEYMKFDGGAVKVLLFLLRWPMQSLFVEALGKCGWSYMDSEDCSVVFCALADKMGDGVEDYDYSQLFWECWHRRPIRAKRFHLTDHPFLIKLLDTERKEFVQWIRKEAPPGTFFELSRYYPELEEQSADESASSDAEMMESSSDEEDESGETSEEEEDSTSSDSD